MQRILPAVLLLLSTSAMCFADEHPLSETRRAELKADWEKQVQELSKAIEDRPDEVSLYSRRGDALFFLGRFEDALADYEKMAELKPDLDALHWRRGLAYFYVGKYDEAAAQFERYYVFDKVDRENGIWRYLAQCKAHGRDRAREAMLLYEKEDRAPLPDVYRMFAGEIEPAEVLRRINSADLSDQDRQKRLFYAQLYIGLHYDVEGEKEQAIEHLREAVADEKGSTGGYGPSYMWQVARLHYNLLTQPAGEGTPAP